MIVGLSTYNGQVFVDGDCDVDCSKIEDLIKRQNAACGSVKAESLQFVDLPLHVEYYTGYTCSYCITYKWLFQCLVTLCHVKHALKLVAKRLAAVLCRCPCALS